MKNSNINVGCKLLLDCKGGYYLWYEDGKLVGYGYCKFINEMRDDFKYVFIEKRGDYKVYDCVIKSDRYFDLLDYEKYYYDEL